MPFKDADRSLRDIVNAIGMIEHPKLRAMRFGRPRREGISDAQFEFYAPRIRPGRIAKIRISVEEAA